MSSRHRGEVKVTVYPYSTPTASLPSGKKTVSWVDLGAGVDGSGKSTPHRVSNPGLSSP
jgi:hypothetical protein